MSHAHSTRPTDGENTLRNTLDSRRSVPATQLCDPGPDHDVQLRMLQSAVRVPDHGKRVPFRFIRLEGEARHAFSQRMAARSRERDPSASDAVVEKDRLRFLHAPLILTVVAEQGDDPKIPASERLLSAGSVCFALLQAAQALGFGAVWLTGWAAYDSGIRRVLGVKDDEAIVGFIHIGSVRTPAPERDRPDPTQLLTDWTP